MISRQAAPPPPPPPAVSRDCARGFCIRRRVTGLMSEELRDCSSRLSSCQVDGTRHAQPEGRDRSDSFVLHGGGLSHDFNDLVGAEPRARRHAAAWLTWLTALLGEFECGSS